MKKIYSIYLVLILTVSALLTACSSANPPDTPDTPTDLPPISDKAASDESADEAESSADTDSADETESTSGTEPADGTESENLSFAMSDTFQSLLDEVNEEHKAITFFEGDYSPYLGKNENPEIDPAAYAGNRNTMPRLKSIVTPEQVKADLEIYYELLRTQYAGYKYFGGDEAFRAAFDAILAECSSLETITVKSWVNIMIKHLSFVQDGHFSIGGSFTGDYDVPFFFRTIAFQKTDDGYAAMDGRIVASVDGFENLDELFKLSLTKEGDLVYYPVVLEIVSRDKMEAGRVYYSADSLTVRFTDGTTIDLTADPYSQKSYNNKRYVDYRVENGIPITTIHYIDLENGRDALSDAAVESRDFNISIVDLRTCQGGISAMFDEWYSNYTQRDMIGHSYLVYQGEAFVTNKGVLYPDPSKANDIFTSSDNILILLTSKITCSSGEHFVDIAHNLENTLIIGENTNGTATCSLRMWTLPNTGMFVTFGDALHLFPEGDHFKEFRGFYPDIWVPANEAEEAAMNFIAKNTTNN